MVERKHLSGRRLNAQAGIAIGPILFIIAILAILAAAIAAGSGSFTSGTANESNRTKGAALIQIGENLKTGMDRLVMENEIPLASVDTDVTHTTGNNGLFSPSGGGITAPSYSLANSPSSDGTAAHGDIWFFPQGAIPGLGTNAPELLAVLRVAPGVCDEINSKANSMVTPPGSDLGDFTSPNNDLNLLDAWPPALNGHTIGCVVNTDSNSSGDYFFEVLAIQ